MRFNDALIGAALILFALAEIAYARTFPRLHGQDYGPELFPTLIGAGLLASGAALVVRGLGPAREPWLRLGAWARERRAALDVALIPTALVFYIVASEWLGFVPSALLILVVLLVRLGTGLVLSIAFALATVAAMQLLFARVLLVPLPAGLLGPLLW